MREQKKKHYRGMRKRKIMRGKVIVVRDEREETELVKRMIERKEKIIERRDKRELGGRGKEQKEMAQMNNRG